MMFKIPYVCQEMCGLCVYMLEDVEVDKPQVSIDENKILMYELLRFPDPYHFLA